MVSAGCEVRVRGRDRWESSRECGRPVERDGKCKMHLRVEERRAEKDKKWREDWDRARALQADAEELSASLGIDVEANYHFSQGYDGRFVVDGDWLRKQARG